MKLILYAMITSLLIFQVSCESYHRDEGSDIQREEEKVIEPKGVDSMPEKGGNAGNK